MSLSVPATPSLFFILSPLASTQLLSHSLTHSASPVLPPSSHRTTLSTTTTLPASPSLSSPSHHTKRILSPPRPALTRSPIAWLKRGKTKTPRGRMSAPSSSSDPHSGPAPPTVDLAEEPTSAPSDAAATVPPAEGAGAPVESAPLSGTHTPAANDEPMIDPELASLPAPANPHRPTPPNNGALASGTEELEPPLTMSITESIAAAPAPRPTDFMPNLDDQEAGIDLDALQVDEDAPGSPTAKVMRAIAPPNAAQLDQKWPAVSPIHPDPHSSKWMRCCPDGNYIVRDECGGSAIESCHRCYLISKMEMHRADCGDSRP
jgi:hypothetical protein